MGSYPGSTDKGWQGQRGADGASALRRGLMQDGASRLQIWDLDPNHVQATLGQLYYTYSKGEASSRNIRSMISNLDVFVTQSSMPIGYVLHLVSTAKPPSTQDREATTSMFNRHAARISGLAVVIEAEGFTGAALRSAVTMVFLMTCRGFPTRTFSTLRAAAEWMSEKQRVPAGEMLRLAREAHGAMPQQ